VRLDLGERDLPGVVELAPPAGAGDAPLAGGNPFVAVPYLFAAVRRRWRVWAVTGLVGVVAGMILTVAVPPRPTASATVLLVHPSQAQPTHAMLTDVGLLQTTTVAQGAIDRLHLPMSARTLLAQFSGKPRSDDLLTVVVEGPTGRDATRRAAAVLDSFLAFRTSEFRRQADIGVKAIEDRRATLTADLAAVTDRINNSLVEEKTDAAVRAFGELLNLRASLNDQISGLRQRIEDANAESNEIINNSRVIDPPTVDDVSWLRIVLGNVGAGGILGLSVGIGWVLVQAITTDRARRRDEVLESLAAPVALSVGPLRGGGPVQRRRFQRHLDAPHPEVAAMVGHLRRVLRRSGGQKPALLIAALDSPWPAAVAVAAAAMELRDDGNNVLVVDVSPEAAVREVFDVPPEPISSYRSASTGSTLALAFPRLLAGRSDRDLEVLRKDADLVLVLSSLDLADDADALSEWATTAVAVVTAGRSSATALRSKSRMLLAAGIHLDSAVLVGADAHDETLGVPPPRPERGLQAIEDRKVAADPVVNGSR